jgi:hypothetical protein
MMTNKKATRRRRMIMIIKNKGESERKQEKDFQGSQKAVRATHLGEHQLPAGIELKHGPLGDVEHLPPQARHVGAVETASLGNGDEVDLRRCG